MRKIFQKNIPAFQFHLLQKFSDEVEHAVFSRLGGTSKAPFDSLNVSFKVGDEISDVQKNRELICDSLKLPGEDLFSAKQSHSRNIVVIDEKVKKAHSAGKIYDDVDGFITNIPGVGLMILAADCQAILMLDPVQKVIAAVHAGWRGQVQDISGRALELMKNNFGSQPENILVGISPSLGPCCATFADLDKELPPLLAKYLDEDRKVDLWELSVEQLESHGVDRSNIELARVCTACGGGGKFFSFRRDDGVTGRFGTIIYLK